MTAVELYGPGIRALQVVHADARLARVYYARGRG
jgi:hypothetical protein